LHCSESTLTLRAKAKTVKLNETSIICIKGKLIKRVTEVKPARTAGYKKKWPAGLPSMTREG
jgi:hypothetical protein